MSWPHILIRQIHMTFRPDRLRGFGLEHFVAHVRTSRVVGFGEEFVGPGRFVDFVAELVGDVCGGVAGAGVDANRLVGIDMSHLLRRRWHRLECLTCVCRLKGLVLWERANDNVGGFCRLPHLASHVNAREFTSTERLACKKLLLSTMMMDSYLAAVISFHQSTRLAIASTSSSRTLGHATPIRLTRTLQSEHADGCYRGVGLHRPNDEILADLHELERRAANACTWRAAMLETSSSRLPSGKVLSNASYW